MRPLFTWCIRYLRDNILYYARYSSDQELFMRTLCDIFSNELDLTKGTSSDLGKEYEDTIDVEFVWRGESYSQSGS